MSFLNHIGSFQTNRVSKFQIQTHPRISLPFFENLYRSVHLLPLFGAQHLENYHRLLTDPLDHGKPFHLFILFCFPRLRSITFFASCPKPISWSQPSSLSYSNVVSFTLLFELIGPLHQSYCWGHRVHLCQPEHHLRTNWWIWRVD